jgi:hypothetical protein
MNSNSPNRPAAGHDQARANHPRPQPDTQKSTGEVPEPRSGRPDDVNPNPEHHWNDAGPDDPASESDKKLPRQDLLATHGLRDPKNTRDSL